MSVVAVQSVPLGLHPAFHQNHHSAPPPASLVSKRTPGIITLSRPISTPKPISTPQRLPRQRKATPSNTPRDAPRDAPAPTPRSEKSRKPRSRPTSDEDEHETPSKARGRRPNNQEKTAPSTPTAPKARRNQSRTRQTPSPDSDSPAPAPQLQKPSGRLAKHRRGFTKSTPALCAAVAAPGSAPVPIPQLSNSNSHPSGLSRSAPLATPAMSQSIPARMRRTPTGGSPARDDPTKDVPPSPSPPRRVREGKSQGPLTAPLHGGAGFPGRPNHTRSPSEALFNLSLDETDDEPQDMPILFTRSRGGDKVYAGGRFQNGPDPTMLPAPSFLSGF